MAHAACRCWYSTSEKRPIGVFLCLDATENFIFINKKKKNEKQAEVRKLYFFHLFVYNLDLYS
jgi:hypothetical protein